MEESTAENASGNAEVNVEVNVEEQTQHVEVTNEEIPKENAKPPPVRNRGCRPKKENKVNQMKQYVKIAMD